MTHDDTAAAFAHGGGGGSWSTMNAEDPPPSPRRKPIFTEERATFLFGATVETGETPDTFTDRVIAELKRAEILTEEGRIHPRLRMGKPEEGQ